MVATIPNPHPNHQPLIPNPSGGALGQRSVAAMLRRAADAWAPVEHPPLADWCTKNLRMSAGYFAEPGPFELTKRPYWREPLSCMEDPDVQRVTLMADAQAGKTVLIIAALIATSFVDPSPAMLAGPDQDAMRELRDKVYAMCLASPTVAPRVPPQPRWNDRHVDLETMYCYLAYSGSMQRLRGRTCKRVFCTEVDVWQDSPRLGKSAELIRARVKAFPEHLIVMESTPTDEASIVDAEYKRSDQRKFQVPCPHCGRYQELRFFPYRSGKFAGRGGVVGLTDAKGNDLTPDDARDTAHYLCIAGCKITSDQKSGMIVRGRWCPKGQRLTRRGKLVGRPLRGSRHAGFQLSAIYADHVTFGDVASEYLAAKETNSLRVFFNNWLGLPYAAGATMPKWRVLARKLQWSHRRGTVPAEAWFLTAAADVQADRVYWVVRAWGDRATSWLVDWGQIKREAGDDRMDESGLVASDLAQLVPRVLEQRFPVDGVNPLGRAELRVRVLGVDAGHRTTDVHQFVRSQPGGRVRALHGDDKVDPAAGYRMNLVEKNARTGKPYEGGLELWGIYVALYKEDLASRFQGEVNQPGAFRFPRGVIDEPDGVDYLRQLVNEGPVLVTLPSGRQVVKWQTRDRSLGEHYWDCEVYGRCLADMVTGGQWDADRWRKPAEQAAGGGRQAVEEGGPAARDYEGVEAR